MLLLLLLWPCLLLLITLYLVVINECCSEAHGAHVEFVWWGGICTVIFVSTPSLTDLDWTVRLDWSLTISMVVVGCLAVVGRLLIFLYFCVLGV